MRSLDWSIVALADADTLQRLRELFDTHVLVFRDVDIDQPTQNPCALIGSTSNPAT
jgi:hypothetical protein